MEWKIIKNTTVFFAGEGHTSIHWSVTFDPKKGLVGSKKANAKHILVTLETSTRLAEAAGVTVREAAIASFRHELGHKKYGLRTWEALEIEQGALPRKRVVELEAEAWIAGYKLRLDLPKISPEVYTRVASFCLGTYEERS